MEDKFRSQVKIVPISHRMINPRTGRSAQYTTSFNLTYEAKEDPETVKSVTEELTAMLLNEDLKMRTAKAEATSQFLEAELSTARRRSSEIEAEISAFKEKHIHELPELLSANIENLETMDDALNALNKQHWAAKATQSALRTQLATIPPTLETVSQEIVNETESRLAALKIELADLKSSFSDEYPDIIPQLSENLCCFLDFDPI